MVPDRKDTRKLLIIKRYFTKKQGFSRPYQAILYYILDISDKSEIIVNKT
jgi:hypothetical protein